MTPKRHKVDLEILRLQFAVPGTRYRMDRGMNIRLV